MTARKNANVSIRKRFLAASWRLFVTATVCWLLSSSAGAADPDFQLCFPSVDWFSGTTPTIDGNVTEMEWLGAFRYVVGHPTGASPQGVILQGSRDNSNIYLAIEANNLTSLTETGDFTTVVVLAFDPVGDPAHMKRIHVYPVDKEVLEGTDVNVDIEYWADNQASWAMDPAGDPVPIWLQTNTRVSYGGSGPFQWKLEMRIPFEDPTAAVGNQTIIPASGNFGLYIDVFRVIGGNYVQSAWPSNAEEQGCPSVGSCFPYQKTPPFTSWGTSTIAPVAACKGVSVGSWVDNIFTDNTPTSLISLAQPNTFHAYVQNTSVDAMGLPVIAEQVKATFKIANFGLPAGNEWLKVNTTGNPTAVKDIPAMDCSGPIKNNNLNCRLSTDPWTLSTAEQTIYSMPGAIHQCIRVDLETIPGGNTLILNNTAYQNMDFGTASRFERTAQISGKGYSLPAGATNQLFDLHVMTNKTVLSPTPNRTGPNLASTAGKVLSQMTWVAEGCRHTGLYMTIKGQTRELCEAVGGFGYVVQHTGDAPVTDWNETLQGSGVTRVSDAIYRVQVPQGGIATVTTRANPQDSGQSNGGSFAALLTGGVAIPHGSFANTHDPGFTIRGGVEYIATTNLSLEGIARYQRFPAQVGPGMNSYQLSANAKAYVSSGSIRPFVNGGIGSYKLSGAWEFGGNLGGGLLMRANSQVSVLGAYNLHLVNTAATTTKFSTIEGGIRYRF